MSGSAAAFSFCLSAAAILRCPSLTRIEHIIIVIPTVLEVLFSSSLIWTLRKSGQKRHLLLAFEGWFYLILSIFNLLSHILPAARTNVGVFSGFDMTVGAASFVPLFLYTFFLYIYTNAELLSNNPSLPRLLGRIGSLVLLFSIPAIVVANEVASFSGVRRIVVDGRILIGFDNKNSYTINTFFSYLTLALLILFQAIVFLIAFFRVIKALMNQRKYQSTGRDANHMVRGMAWLSVGTKLGVIETFVGFAGGGFDIVIIRRILRFVARAFLCVGISKGVDKIEDFRAVRKEMLDSARSRGFQGDAPGLRAMISNPRASTFQRLSPTAKKFYSLPRAHLLPQATFDYNKEYNRRDQDSLSIDDERRTLARMRSLQELEGIAVFANLKEEVSKKLKERVTIGYRDSSGAPTLLLRLSSGKFPSLTGFVPSARSSISASNKFQKMPDSPGPQYTAAFTFSATQGKKAQQEYRKSEAASVYSTDTMGADYITLLRPNASVLAPIPLRMYRDSSTPSMGPSITDSGVEIINAPRRKVFQTAARALLYNVNNGSAPNDAPITKGSPKPIFASQFMESSLGYQASSNSVVPIKTQGGKSSGQFRVVSDYSSINYPGTDTLQTVPKQFPQTSIMSNDRPLMSSVGKNTYDSSAPMDKRRSPGMIKGRVELPPAFPASDRGGARRVAWLPTAREPQGKPTP